MKVDNTSMLDRARLSFPAMAAGKNDTQGESESGSQSGVRVSLSAEGLMRSNGVKKSDSADESELPDEIKQILRMIRELKQQIAEKQAELQAIMSDPGLSQEARQTQVDAMQATISTLQGALASANATLLKIMKDSGLNADQLASIPALM